MLEISNFVESFFKVSNDHGKAAGTFSPVLDTRTCLQAAIPLALIKLPDMDCKDNSQISCKDKDAAFPALFA